MDLSKSEILRQERAAGKKLLGLRRSYNASLRGGGARPGRMKNLTERKGRQLMFCKNRHEKNKNCESRPLLIEENENGSGGPNTIAWKKNGSKVQYQYPKAWKLGDKDWHNFDYRGGSDAKIKAALLVHVHREMAKKRKLEKERGYIRSFSKGRGGGRRSQPRKRRDCGSALAEGYQKMDKHGYPRCYFRMVEDNAEKQKAHLARIIKQLAATEDTTIEDYTNEIVAIANADDDDDDDNDDDDDDNDDDDDDDEDE